MFLRYNFNFSYSYKSTEKRWKKGMEAQLQDYFFYLCIILPYSQNIKNINMSLS